MLNLVRGRLGRALKAQSLGQIDFDGQKRNDKAVAWSKTHGAGQSELFTKVNLIVEERQVTERKWIKSPPSQSILILALSPSSRIGSKLQIMQVQRQHLRHFYLNKTYIMSTLPPKGTYGSTVTTFFQRRE